MPYNRIQSFNYYSPPPPPPSPPYTSPSPPPPPYTSSPSPPPPPPYTSHSPPPPPPSPPSPSPTSPSPPSPSPPPPSPPLLPPLPPPPPPSSPPVVVIVCVSIGGLFFLAFLAGALFCFRKRLRKGAAEEAEAVAVVEHVRVHEDIVPGPCGEPEVAAVSVDEDIEVVEMVEKSDAVVEGEYSGLAFGRKPPEISRGSPIHKG